MARHRRPGGGKPVPASLLDGGWGDAERAWMDAHGIDPLVVLRYRRHRKLAAAGVAGDCLTGEDLAEIASWRLDGQ